jgi:hypothetical protein
MFRTAAIAILSLSLTGASAFAADGSGPASENVVFTPFVKTVPAAPETVASPMATNVDWTVGPAFKAPSHAASRPAALPVLYASLALLNAYDVYSTRQGLSRGAVENNALMKQVAGNPTAFIAVKALTTAVPMVLAERMWKNGNRKGAIMTMIVANGVAAAIGANNMQVLQQVR